MENRKIDIDDAVWELLKKNAAESGESPNEILKRVLEAHGRKEGEQPKACQGKDWQCS